MGISISKKVLKRATDRNRIKRLIREVYREIREQIPKVDVHIVAREWDLESWMKLKKSDVATDWKKWTHELQNRS